MKLDPKMSLKDFCDEMQHRVMRYSLRSLTVRQALRFARKHFGWYAQYFPDGPQASRHFNKLETPAQQQAFVRDYFGQLIEGEVRAA